METQSFVERFLKGGRTGFYHAVVEEGVVAAGDLARFVDRLNAPTPSQTKE